VIWFAAAVAALGAALAAYAWLEAGWLRTRVLDVHIAGLPAELDGLRVAHLSDFHLGPPSRGRRATERAVAWVAERRPDLVAITGDLVSHPRGEPLLRDLLSRLERPFVVLGNHDVAVTRDPFSRAAELEDLDKLGVLLGDASVVVERRGHAVQVVGVDPVTYHRRTASPAELVDPAAPLRILLCHFPGIVQRLPADAFHLTLAGHFHAGQIVLAFPGGRLALAHPRAERLAGLYETEAGVLHISPGTGTTLVPFRLCARPEATELVLRTA
jgi:hypothetical protein